MNKGNERLDFLLTDTQCARDPLRYYNEALMRIRDDKDAQVLYSYLLSMLQRGAAEVTSTWRQFAKTFQWSLPHLEYVLQNMVDAKVLRYTKYGVYELNTEGV